jgi:hypothetical protein
MGNKPIGDWPSVICHFHAEQNFLNMNGIDISDNVREAQRGFDR